MDVIMRDDPSQCDLGDGIFCSELMGWEQFSNQRSPVHFVPPNRTPSTDPGLWDDAGPPQEPWIFILAHATRDDGVTVSIYGRIA